MSLNQQLDCLFNPGSVAVVGASSFFGKWGYNILSRLISTRGTREIFPVNDREAEVLGLKAYRSVRDVPGHIDVAIVTVPSQDLRAVMHDCVRKGVKAAVVITSGLAECGAEGTKLEQELVKIAERGGMRFVGPNCLGIADAHSGFCTVGFLPPVRKGNVALVSQSGNSGQSVLNYGHQMGLGFSKFVSSGNEADLHFEDYFEYLASDDKTDVILAYVEGLREGRRFLDLARAVTPTKPVVIMKSGRTDVGSRAARSHSAALAGSDAVFDAALRQSGVLRAETVEELVDVAVALLGQPLPKGRRVAVLSMGGGMAVTAADALRREGLELPPLSPATVAKLDSILSDRWSRSNPVDPAGDFVNYHCLWPIIEDENTDAVLMVGGVGMAVGYPGWAPSSMKHFVASVVKPIEYAELENLEKTLRLMDRCRKPVILTVGVTGAENNGRVPMRLKRLHRNLYSTPEAGARVLSRLVQYAEYLGAVADQGPLDIRRSSSRH
jgi:acyl-CoA synthetase (NDP forming)